MVELSDIVAFLDQELRITSIPDYPGAVNGLQLANSGKVGRIVAAVDASLPVVEEAAKDGPGLLIVHHGMFWQGVQTLTGAFYRKIKVAMDAGLAIYSSHLPLDVHPEWGNNVRLSRAIGLGDQEPFFENKGICMGIRGSWSGSIDEFVQVVSGAVGGAVHLCPAGPRQISKIGVITGGAGSEVQKVASMGINTFVTGEGPHWSYTLAEELGINVIYAGHYATETFGVRALAEMLGDAFGVPHSFVDRATGL